MGHPCQKKKGGWGMLWGYWVKQNKMKTNRKTLYRVNNIFESDFPGSCTKSDDLFSFV